MTRASFSCAQCGAAVTVSSHNRAEVDRYAAWCTGQGRLCAACRAAEFATQNEAAVAASSGLPTLAGSEKQVAWAATIRLEMLPQIEAAVTTIGVSLDAAAEKNPAAATEIAEMRDAVALVAAEMQAQTSAAWWIDHRGSTVKALIQDAVRQRAATLLPTYTARMLATRDA